MKKKYLLLIALITCVGFSNAQEADLNGIWKLTKSIKYGDQTHIRSTFITFKDTGSIEVSGQDLGTWIKNEAENTLTINCDHFEEIEGQNKIETLDEKELKLINYKGEISILQKASLPEGKELNNKLTGEWLLNKEEKNGKTDFVGLIVDLNSNGIFYTQGMIFGTWDYNKATKKIIFDVIEEKDPFNGDHSIIKSNKETFIMDVEGTKLYFSKIDNKNIAKENGASGLIGTWRHSDEENPDTLHILEFKSPNKFLFVENTEYSKRTSNGMWIFNENEKTVILIGRLEKLRGLNKVIAITNSEISLENNGTIFSFKKEDTNNVEIEQLTFSEEDFYDENGNYKYDFEEQKLPWPNRYQIINHLSETTQFVYLFSELITGTKTFKTKTLKANVIANSEENVLIIDNIFNGYDRYNLPEDSAFPDNPYDDFKPLYPLSADNFRVIGEEEITIKARVFNCLIIEAIDSFGVKVKIWMVIDQPGVIAKVIKEDSRMSNYYMFELKEIIKN